MKIGNTYYYTYTIFLVLDQQKKEKVSSYCSIPRKKLSLNDKLRRVEKVNFLLQKRDKTSIEEIPLWIRVTSHFNRLLHAKSKENYHNFIPSCKKESA